MSEELSQLWDARHDTEPHKPAQTLRLVSSAVILAQLLAELPMDEGHQYYDDWNEHTSRQPHQGC